MRDDFCIFILSHGRAGNIKTLDMLNRTDYKGKWFIVIDNEDKQQDKYKQLYKEKVIRFDKYKISNCFDIADITEDRRSVVFARNACFNIANDLGINYFLQLDDDYKDLQFRTIKGKKLLVKKCYQFEKVCNAMIKFLDDSGALSVALAQGGDFIGGSENGNFKKGLLRKAMNTFFCKTDRKFDFVGKINEDVNTYTSLGNKGELFFTITNLMIVQEQTQKNKGGMTDIYLDGGTYIKSFFSVIFSPNCVKIGTMGDKQKRMHHKINWNNCTPKILNERYRKEEAYE